MEIRVQLTKEGILLRKRVEDILDTVDKTTDNLVERGIKTAFRRARNAVWRSGWDSNPRPSRGIMISSHVRYDHFDTAAGMSRTVLEYLILHRLSTSARWTIIRKTTGMLKL